MSNRECKSIPESGSKGCIHSHLDLGKPDDIELGAHCIFGQARCESMTVVAMTSWDYHVWSRLVTKQIFNALHSSLITMISFDVYTWSCDCSEITHTLCLFTVYYSRAVREIKSFHWDPNELDSSWWTKMFILLLKRRGIPKTQGTKDRWQGTSTLHWLVAGNERPKSAKKA